MCVRRRFLYTQATLEYEADGVHHETVGIATDMHFAEMVDRLHAEMLERHPNGRAKYVRTECVYEVVHVDKKKLKAVAPNSDFKARLPYKDDTWD